MSEYLNTELTLPLSRALALSSRFTEFISADASKLGLSVTAICYHPGGIKTGLAANMGPGMDFLFTDTPELAAGTAVWLTSGQADFLDGRYVSATWDMSDLKAREKEIAEKDLLRTRVVFD